jgi:septal ring factor EnvC (AmiA/AmiB activator)
MTDDTDWPPIPMWPLALIFAGTFVAALVMFVDLFFTKPPQLGVGTWIGLSVVALAVGFAMQYMRESTRRLSKLPEIQAGLDEFKKTLDAAKLDEVTTAISDLKDQLSTTAATLKEISESLGGAPAESISNMRAKLDEVADEAGAIRQELTDKVLRALNELKPRTETDGR